MEESDPGMVLLAALHSKLSLSYMLTAAPNWQNLPIIDGVDWDLAYGFSHHERRVGEEPLLIVPALLERRANAIRCLRGAFVEIAAGCNIPLKREEALVEDQVRVLIDMPFEEVIDDLETMVTTPEQAAAIVKGPSGVCTDLYPMVCQALSILSKWKVAAEKGGGGPVILQYGVFTHALDPKHLAAAVFAMRRWPPHAEFPDKHFREWLEAMPTSTGNVDTKGVQRRKPLDDVVEELRQGLGQMQTLMQMMLTGEPEGLEPLTEVLLQCRFKQVLMLQLYSR
eukprot:gnl/MRDRNA2_/MRDRNA2_266741_c0_seq1.p1 gnl/MRDRNA2_/MRDRNA2_266741_c0~~gnl/MRDRNA2_/MRDRNA2_266741_c0_seq1.p1  ORF type:complete len:282 (-),score=57.58 gnl/MRDRNA2_/MRDRNA2_266741_c0_seq1:20-865(-)